MTNLEKLRTGTPKQIADMLCKCLKNCSACPHSFRECCNNGEKNGFEEWLNEETIAPKDAPKDILRGWIKLRTPKSAIYIDASKIVGLGAPNTAVVPDELRTTVYTIGAEDNPWIVCDRIDEVMEKIKKASQEK
jgi:hypothetical protein